MLGRVGRTVSRTCDRGWDSKAVMVMNDEDGGERLWAGCNASCDQRQGVLAANLNPTSLMNWIVRGRKEIDHEIFGAYQHRVARLGIRSSMRPRKPDLRHPALSPPTSVLDSRSEHTSEHRNHAQFA
ncbi:hypothetical protein D9615_008489 [Tricholomella constricta]|uniref:Uncharacterized protein n=1 Tax=Tricholomella constricta TaxID=117010 RepID=A0A8H5H448_9AGAR|nr:hypothetical protein D9615_008489 [Tricholomella constricta]